MGERWGEQRTEEEEEGCRTGQPPKKEEEEEEEEDYITHCNEDEHSDNDSNNG